MNSSGVSLSPGYVAKAEKKSGPNELVIVVEDSPTKIVLQHLLVMDDGMVIKHWRQDWEYQAKRRFEFVSDQTWRMRDIKPELISGAWTQCVFEVSDAPRYCGTGRFVHSFGVATWTSDHTWRPLPRREYTTRSDYNALDVINRHSITPNGWTHEQDNTKIVRNGENTSKTLVREFGFNDYRNTSEHNFEPGRDYWKATQTYWAYVRAEWDKRFAQNGQVQILTGLTDTQLMSAFEEQARTWLPENQKSDSTPSTDADAGSCAIGWHGWLRVERLRSQVAVMRSRRAVLAVLLVAATLPRRSTTPPASVRGRVSAAFLRAAAALEYGL